MQKSLKKLLSAVISVLIVLSTVTVALAAVGVDSLVVDGITVIRTTGSSYNPTTSVVNTQGNGWTYDQATNTLTLTNSDISNIRISSNRRNNPELIIKLVGSNIVDTISPDDMELYIVTDGENAYLTCTEEFDFTAAGNVTIGKNVTFVNSVYLRLEQGETLTNNGTIINIGTIDIRDNRTTIVNNGTIINKGSITNPNRVKGNGTITTEGSTDVPCGHTYSSWSTRINATCEETGLKSYAQCTKCGLYFDNEGNEITGPYDEALIIPALGHSFGEWTPEESPENCTDEGRKGYYYCSVCEKYFDEDKKTEIADLTIGGGEHVPAEAVTENEKANSCTEDGSYDTVIYCTVCEEELSRETTTVSASGHTEGAEATCTASQICTVCGVVLENAFGHKEGVPVTENEKANSCTEDGSYDTVIYCTVCEEELSRETTTVSASGHTEGAEATCTAPQICTVCGVVLENALGHTAVTDKAVAPTCMEKGLKEGSHCSACGEILVAQKEIAKIDHKFGEYKSDNNATCTENGTKSACCIYGCGTKKTTEESYSKLAHEDYDGDGKCDCCGSTAIGYCDLCGGPEHENFISNVICIITSLFRLITSFIRDVF